VRLRLSGGTFLAVVIAASCAWLVFYAHGALAREANKRMESQVEKQLHKDEAPNSNYWLLSRVIEKVTGQSYEEALRHRILEPAGMRNSGLVHDWPKVPHAAVGYWMTREGKVVRAPVVDGSMSSGDGGIYSTRLRRTRRERSLA
jgi:CubicO group peptidase (beta-lactamase class C family)